MDSLGLPDSYICVDEDLETHYNSQSEMHSFRSEYER